MNLRLKVRAGNPRLGPWLANSRNPSVGVQMLRDPYKRVESSVD
jgi:hypothetical protein